MFKTALLILSSAAIIISAAEIANTDPVFPTLVIDSIKTVKNESTSWTNPTTVVTTVEPNTTTQVPTTTPVPPTKSPTSPPPTAPPTPVPAPDTGKWNVNGTNETCIIAQMAVQFNVPYITEKNELLWKVIDLPVNDTVASGTCGSSNSTEQNLILIWNTNTTGNLNVSSNNLTFHFVKNLTENRYAIHHFEVSFARDEFPKISPNYSTTFVHNGDVFKTGLSNSYRCLKIQTLNLTRADNKIAGNMTISNLQFQAFHSDENNVFGFAEDCAFDTPDIVPIAVGCALAILVVIVLIAYLVGRRRSQARGYLSM